jgi:phage-related protein
VAVSGKIADGVIKIALAGLEAAKAQLAAAQSQAQKLGQSLGTIGSASSRGFAVATAGITGFLKAADPVRFEIFSQKLQVLAMYIGLSFIPILDDAITTVDRLIAYFANLTDGQREQILHWTKIVTTVLAAGAALGTVVAVLPKALGLLRALSVVIGLLTAETGIGLVLALAGVAFAVLEMTGGLDKLMPLLGRLQAAFSGFVDKALGPLLDVFAEVAGQVVDQFVAAFEELAPVVAELGREIGRLVSEALPIFAQLGKEFGAVVSAVVGALAKLIPPFVQIFGVFMKLYTLYIATLAKVFLGLAGAVVSVLPAFVQVLGMITDVIGELTPVVTELIGVFGDVLAVLAEVGAEIAKLAGEVIGELVKALADLFKEFWKTFGPDIIDFIRTVAAGIKVLLDVVKAVVQELKEMVEALKEAWEIAKALNPFGGGGGGRPGGSGAGDFGGGGGAAGGPEDFGDGGGGDRFWKDIIGQIGGAFGGGGQRFAPLAKPVKVENFGIEEAFKKAQQGASFDPAKIAENERRRFQQDALGHLGNIDRNTNRRPAAEAVR